MRKLWERLDGHKTKIGNSLLLIATQLPPSNAQIGLFIAGSLLTGVGLADVMKKVILGQTK